MTKARFPEFCDECSSLLKLYLSQAIWDELSTKETSNGYTLQQLIRSGVEQQDSSIGAYAGDGESYVLFAPLLKPIIRHYHESTGPHPPADFSVDQLPDLSAKAQSKILSTRIRVGRNLHGFPLGAGLAKNQRLQVEALIKHALANLPESLRGEYLSLPAMSEKRRDDLVARHLLYKSEDRFLTSGGLMRDWPEGRGLYLAKDNAFSVWINEEDQMRIIALQPGGDIARVFQLLAAGVQALSQHLDFLHSEDYGYLASCPSNLGTAMRASVHMKLESLAKDQAHLKNLADSLGLQIRGNHGEHSQSSHGVFDISNRKRLGVTETAAVSHLIQGINALAEQD